MPVEESHLEKLEACKILILLINMVNGKGIQQLHNELHKDFYKKVNMASALGQCVGANRGGCRCLDKQEWASIFYQFFLYR